MWMSLPHLKVISCSHPDEYVGPCGQVKTTKTWLEASFFKMTWYASLYLTLHSSTLTLVVVSRSPTDFLDPKDRASL